MDGWRIRLWSEWDGWMEDPVKVRVGWMEDPVKVRAGWMEDPVMVRVGWMDGGSGYGQSGMDGWRIRSKRSVYPFNAPKNVTRILYWNACDRLYPLSATEFSTFYRD